MKRMCKNEYIDELLKKTLGREKRQFDFDKWKEEHQKEIRVYENQSAGEGFVSRTKPVKIWRIVMHSRMIKFAAAVVIVGLMVLMQQYTGSIDGASAAFAQMTEAVKKMPWIHAIYYYDEAEAVKQGSVRCAEQWFSFSSITNAYIFTDGSVDYSSGDQRKSFEYDPESQTLKIKFWVPNMSSTRDGKPLSEVTAQNYFDYDLMMADDPKAVISRSTGVYDGNKFDILQIEVEKEDYSRKLSFFTDTTTHLPQRLDWEVVSGGQTFREHIEIEYPEKGPENIYDLGVPKNAEKIVDEMPQDDFLEVWDKCVECKNSFYDATAKSIAVITEENRALEDGVWVNRMNRVVVEYKDAPQFCWYSYQLGDDFNPPDEPQTVNELPQTFEGLLKWSKTIKLYPYYTGKRTATLWKDSPWPPRLIKWIWPIVHPVYYRVIEDDYSIENNLICIERIQKRGSRYFEMLRKHNPESLKNEKLTDSYGSYDRFVYYLNPQRDYICERYMSQWKIIEDKPDSVSIRDVVEYGKTDSGKWYAEKFRTVGFEDGKQTAESNTVIYLKTDIDFPQAVFDEKLDLPEYEDDVYVP